MEDIYADKFTKDLGQAHKLISLGYVEQMFALSQNVSLMCKSGAAIYEIKKAKLFPELEYIIHRGQKGFKKDEFKFRI